MKYGFLFKIEKEEFPERLFRNSAKGFVVPEVRRKFKKNNISLSKSSYFKAHRWTDTSLKKPKEKVTKVLIDKGAKEIKAYYFWEEEEQYNVKKGPASGQSSLLSNHSVYEIGVPTVNEEENKKTIFLISGDEREKLQGKQRQKWDYFFRIYYPQIGKQQKRRIKKLNKEIEEWKKKIKNEYLLIGMLILGMILFITSGELAIQSIAILCIATMGWLGLKVRKLSQKIEIAQRWIHTYKLEIKYLQNQVPPKEEIPTENQIEEWLVQELNELEEEAIKELDIDPSQLLPLDQDQNFRDGLKSIFIEEIGISQPKKVHGRDYVNAHHMEAIRVRRNGLPHFGVYYFQFIFLTADKITVLGFFYDFILNRKQGNISDEFYYSDVVSVVTKRISITSPFDESVQWELDVFKLGVPNSESIQVALSDMAIIDDMNERIEAKKKLKEEGFYEDKSLDEELGLTNNDPAKEFDYQKHAHLIEVAEADLPKTRARAAISRIRRELRSRKGVA